MITQKPSLRLEVRPTIRARSPRELLIFSLDDTLVDTNMYGLSRAAFARAKAAKTGLPEEPAAPGFEPVTIRNPREPESLPVTIHEIWACFQEICGGSLPSGDVSSYGHLMQCLRSKYPEAIPGAEDLLKWAQTHFVVALFAQGETAGELEKVEGAKLTRYFSKTKVVPSKGAGELRAMIEEMAFSPRNTWLVGNSIRSDINPGLEVGVNCIHYSHPRPRAAGRPADDAQSAGNVFRIHELSDARAILARV